MSLEAPTTDRDSHGSAADYAYAALRREIVERRFTPGRRMREIELSEWLGISRTPTRQALARLEVEGLLTMVPRNGLVVASLDERATTELYEMRLALEGSAAAFAARHASERDIAKLNELLELEQHLPEDADALYRHNLAFHQALYAAGHNRFLVKSLAALHDAMSLLGPTTLAQPGRPVEALAEHRLIIDAIVRRDADAAERAARDHIHHAFNVRKRMPPLSPV
ncbi:GntR family transcriptional regulator [Agaricicola taiwanensis]|uniref:GntR family transcriptional regulator n=1 Tax=Agaricicola taiwanensis TaxID=591372 RepID=A0A8J2YF27_9RHOB|nr:GntR family transcriptional regulator [Agaricicola taiwanensis]GGE27661.1 GntR family transcriptional regulator [Agaricicola taiwanensis]